MDSTKKSDIPGIGAAAKRIWQDVVYLDPMSRVAAASSLSIDVAAAAPVPLPDVSSHGRRNRAARSAWLRRRSG
ncbi:MAG: hypothetical protein OXC31_18410, partial [Spirochaetaceae bacterium]|nr:hypothetical protein [Spirochaetaceae bacterium]